MKRFLVGSVVVLWCGGVTWAAAQEERPTRTDSCGIRLVRIPAGAFRMGGHESAAQLVAAFAAHHRPAAYFRDEYPQRRVEITRPFWLGAYEVTVGQFRRFAERSGYRTEAETDGTGAWGFNRAAGRCEGRRKPYSWRNPGFAQTDDHPVLNVTWNDAQAFCRWLSAQEGHRYRLPTEAEWEYACRAGTTTRYHCGNDPDVLPTLAVVLDGRGRTAFPHVDETPLSPDLQSLTRPVGRFPPNRWGLYDMHGNVWEWCADWYGEDYYAHAPSADPQGPASGQQRVRRGGAWNSFPLWARASFRNWNTPQSRCVNLGFRVVREEAN
jgi:formylglycine-generating enzyme required for sulfatase activity